MQMGQHHGFDVVLDWVYLLFGLGMLGAIGWSGYKIVQMFAEF